MTRPLIVGEAPGPRTDPSVPLDGRTGRRLAELAGISEEELRRRARIVNVLPRWPGPAGKGSAFDPRAAALPAAEAVRLHARAGSLVLVLGWRAARALNGVLYGVHRQEYLVPERHYLGDVSVQVAVVPDPMRMPGPRSRRRAVRVAVVPHPSGINRWWNDPANVEAARSFLREALG